MKTRGRPRHPDVLTPREWEVLTLVRQGLTNPQIAERMGITLDAAKYHVSEILSKLQLGSREEAAAWRPEPPQVAVLRPSWANAFGNWWQLIAGTAGAGVTVAAVAGLGVLAYGVMQSEGGDEGGDAAGRIAFTECDPARTVSQVCDIYTMNADGSGRERLTGGKEHAGLLAISPDGERLALALIFDDGDRSEIYTMNADGSERTLIREFDVGAGDFVGAGGFAWSPDGSQIAFNLESISGSLDVYVMDADGSGVTALTNTGSDFEPRWSPDGTRIAFYSFREGGIGHVYVMNSDGSGVTRLADGDGAAWSPDGSRLIFEGSNNDGNQDIYVMSADGSDVTRLTEHAGEDGSGSWSPDGKRIAYESCEGVGQFREPCDIFSVGADGTGMTRLTDNDLHTHSPAWSPDGLRISYVMEEGVYVMNADGSGEELVADGSFQAFWVP